VELSSFGKRKEKRTMEIQHATVSALDEGKGKDIVVRMERNEKSGESKSVGGKHAYHQAKDRLSHGKGNPRYAEKLARGELGGRSNHS